ncbi:DUF6541 family protein [Microbacterium sp. B2969]|uniref:DUF6541 family protein n=1 Tax=Microbacterium alkaliflavum TaxID=3248839 RepID=A0ABW7Q4I4_9MICO
MTWLDALPEIAIAIGVLILPGLVVVRLFGARGIVALGAVAPISAGIVAVAGVAAGLVGSAFSPWWVLAVWTVAAVIAFALPRLVPALRPPARRTPALRPPARGTPAVHPPGRREPRRVWWGWLTGLVVSAVLLTWRVTTSLIAPESFSQRFDIVFHLNAVRRVLDGDGSSLTMGRLAWNTDAESFYPAAWHDIAGLVAQLSPGHGISTVAVAVSATNLVIAVVVWSLGALALVRAIAGPRPLALAFAGVFAAAFGAFPLRLLEWGVVLPYFFGVALLPGMMALVIAGCRLRPSAGLPSAQAWALAAVAGVGVALAHASVVVALAVLTIPPVVTSLVGSIRSRRHRGRSTLPVWILVAGYLLVLAAIWIVGRPRNGFQGWDTPHSFLVAVAAFFANAPLGGTVPFAALVLIAIAVVVLAMRRERWWFLGIYAVTGILYIAVAGVPRSPLRTFLTGPWYEDSYRIAAFVVIPGVVAAAIGGDLLVRRIALSARRRRAGGRTLAIGLTAVLIVLMVPSTQFAVTRDADLTRAAYVLDGSSPLITPNELRLLARLPDNVAAGDVIADNPFDGSALAYAFTGRKVLFAHLMHDDTLDQLLIARRLRDAAVDPAVCEALEDTRVRWVLDFGAYLADNPGANEYPGLDDLVAAGVATEVDREGDAVLYRITACG